MTAAAVPAEAVRDAVARLDAVIADLRTAALGLPRRGTDRSPPGP